jgi:hypothetical protein
VKHRAKCSVKHRAKCSVKHRAKGSVKHRAKRSVKHRAKPSVKNRAKRSAKHRAKCSVKHRAKCSVKHRAKCSVKHRAKFLLRGVSQTNGGFFRGKKEQVTYTQYVLFRVCKSAHHSTFNWINQQDAATSEVHYLSFKYCSTCFGHPHVHHQELQELQWQSLVYRRSLVISVLLVVVGPAGPTTTNSVINMGSIGSYRHEVRTGHTGFVSSCKILFTRSTLVTKLKSYK